MSPKSSKNQKPKIIEPRRVSINLGKSKNEPKDLKRLSP
jgi:hypothetical protein